MATSAARRTLRSAPFPCRLHVRATPDLSPAGANRQINGRRQQHSRCLSTTRRMRCPDNFRYGAAASFIGKGLPFDPSEHVLQFDPTATPVGADTKKRRSQRPASGQDAFFISRVGGNSCTSSIAVGVADGVGGWQDSGVDPADFSHALCAYMGAAADAGIPSLTARQVMQEGYDAVYSDSSIHAGGSTAVVGLLNAAGTLEVANLGDSGFMVLRTGGVFASSQPQTHAFNTPFQLSVVPRNMLLRTAAFGGAQLMDSPRDSELTQLSLRHGDVVIVGSDGLWDNLFNQDILRIVTGTMSQTGAWEQSEVGISVVRDLEPFVRLGQQSLQSLLATNVVGAAKSASMNARLDGPFAKEVKKYFPWEQWHGGKVDDICVVAVVVTTEEEHVAPPRAKL